MNHQYRYMQSAMPYCYRDIDNHINILVYRYVLHIPTVDTH